MKKISYRSRNIILGLFTLLFVTSCTTQFVYRHLDWFIGEYVEEYVDLNSQQSERLEKKVSSFQYWHKQKELPRYKKHLDQLANLDLHQLTILQIEHQQLELFAHIERSREKIAPILYSLFTTLTQEQQDQLIKNMTKRIYEYSEKVRDKSEKEHRENYVEKMEGYVDHWFGSVTAQQMQLLQLWSKKILLTKEDWIESRILFIEKLSVLFSEKENSIVYRQQFIDYISHPDALYSDVFLTKIKSNKALFSQMFVKIAHTTTPDQQRHFKNEMRDWKETVISIEED
ncbi:DUF6279 family lipoprotein [Vibrio sp. SS-MA-C1-2]|uniref:DUF6279 family lipoprotein n=1 Tax=Vibrio sp. SS-MA-C1-2 TaxID=2908646 RepID=UPI001F2EDFC5|nr:DUF6279 family lipoprotein [Vibrio sp. SS-MA-C1-2]UJF17727.1 DUF6279 family lipoprotein [Vibrio sp. SS-MA-C1-2]